MPQPEGSTSQVSTAPADGSTWIEVVDRGIRVALGFEFGTAIFGQGAPHDGPVPIKHLAEEYVADLDLHRVQLGMVMA